MNYNAADDALAYRTVEDDFVETIRSARDKILQIPNHKMVLVPTELSLRSGGGHFELVPFSTLDELAKFLPVSALDNLGKINLLLRKPRLKNNDQKEGMYAFGIHLVGVDDRVGILATDFYFRNYDWVFFDSWKTKAPRIISWLMPALDQARLDHDAFYSLIYE